MSIRPDSACELVLEPNFTNLEAGLVNLKALSSEFGKVVPLLADYVENGRSKIKACSMVRNRGFEKLPDELLVPIFKQGYYSLASKYIDIPSVRSNLFIKRVAQVCRRFRFLALSSPELWSTIHSSQPKDEVAAFVERSRADPLTILIYGKDHTRSASDMSEQDLLEFMEALAPCQDRWKEMRITSTPSRTISQLMREVQAHIVALPRFERLHLHRYKWDSDFDEYCDIPAWHAPNLWFFYGAGVVPINFQSSKILHFNLTCQVNTIPEIFTWAVPPCVKQLSLRILNVNDHEVVAFGSSDEPLLLPGLETLEVISSSPGTYTTFWVLVLPKLAFPNIVRMHVRVAGSRIVDLFARLGTHQFANLRELRFVCEDLATLLAALPSLAKFPLLRHVRVDDCCYSSYSAHRPPELALSTLPPLRTFVFTRCRFNNMHGVEALAARLRVVLDLATFERLQFHCYDLEELRLDRAEALRKSLNGKVEIVDCID